MNKGHLVSSFVTSSEKTESRSLYRLKNISDNQPSGCGKAQEYGKTPWDKCLARDADANNVIRSCRGFEERMGRTRIRV